MCPSKLCTPVPPKPVEPPLDWPLAHWDLRFKDIILGFWDILIEELSPKEAIFIAEKANPSQTRC